MKSILHAILGSLLALTVVQSGQSRAQEQASRPKTAGEAEAGTFAWGHGLAYVRNHFVKAAEEFPEDKFSYRPTEEARSFAEIVMHVARVNHLNAADDLGKQPEDVSEFAFHSKAQALAKLKQSFQELDEALKRKPGSANVPDAMIHASEHYGNLATYYRLNGLVPPASR
jgi:DinB superfamily